MQATGERASRRTGTTGAAIAATQCRILLMLISRFSSLYFTKTKGINRRKDTLEEIWEYLVTSYD